MAAIESPEKLGLKPFDEFTEANRTWPRGDRPAAIREAASEFRARFATAENRVRGVRTVDIASAAYPVKFAFGGAAHAVNPYINFINRLVVVQYEDFDGDLRTLVYEPTVTEGPQEAPFYEQLLSKYGEFLSYKVFARFYNEVPEALAKAGVRSEDVDFISFDHLHVQDVRFVLGSTEPAPGHDAPLPALFPEANVGLLEGDVELGRGVALVWTPGHTDGNHSLCINTEEGVWVSSENGVAADNWHPHLSKIPGVRKEAEFFGREVILNSNTLEESIDQYDSMLKEKAIADSNTRDP